MLHLPQSFMIIMIIKIIIIICINIAYVTHIIIIVIIIIVLICETVTSDSQSHKHKIGYVALTCGEMTVSHLEGAVHVQVLLNFRCAFSLHCVARLLLM